METVHGFFYLCLGGIGSNQIQSHKRTDGVTEIIFRKTLAPTSDAHDNEIYEDKATSIVWAIGRLAQKSKREKEPSYHHTYTRRHTAIDFGRKETKNECLPFVQRKAGRLCTVIEESDVVANFFFIMQIFPTYPIISYFNTLMYLNYLSIHLFVFRHDVRQFDEQKELPRRYYSAWKYLGSIQAL